MASAQLRARRRVEAAKQGFRGAVQCLFALAVLMIFALAILVGTGAIKMPAWSRSFTNLPASQRDAYGGALLGCACFFLAVCCGIGVYLQRREARLNAQMNIRSRV
ncbi:hypothetical protein E8E14_002065 [Neopestalotiopsis sp. 37M]|nr:hypothetical protein E8E14_002065 [Neopestalotiopsis sp. 37M]